MQCRHFGDCGGCSLPNVPYASQLESKRARLARLLGVVVPPLIPSPSQTGFRQKTSFVFGSSAGGRGLVMGHYARGSKHIVPVTECPVHSSRGNQIAFALRDHLIRAGVPAADVSGGLLRHLIVRTTEDDAEAVAMLVVSRNDRSLRTPVRSLLSSPDAPDGFFLNINARPGPYMVGAETIRIAGRSHVRERALSGSRGVDRVDYLVSPDAFFQTNVGAARALVDEVVEAAKSASRVLELYCGSGLFTLPLARRGGQVTAIEENRQAIDDLKANIRLNGVPSGRIRPIAARVEDALARVGREQWETIVLDPPREGCSPGVLSGVFDRLKPLRAVYVSCNPDALAKELPRIVKSGYRIERIQPIDMFPHTEHIETVVTLDRK